MPNPSLTAHAYVLAVHDLQGTSAYFIHKLGFETDWEDPGNWHALRRDGVRVMLGRCPDALSPSVLGDHNYFGFLVTDDIDALHADLTARGALVSSPPTDKPWGWREMPVATPEGHRMMFAQAIG
ncbi:VOC family protein [Pleomorphomonas oryzae]|uniref:VOC family protein n=1 Tax=Pleomorphomonas oryzae TaxID=261934 RepID=UPI00040AE364|nr:VOC family protein [Pleomorphomonas oryzae]